jgi:hypothetical protein
VHEPLSHDSGHSVDEAEGAVTTPMRHGWFERPRIGLQAAAVGATMNRRA